jgi:putative FmdB family regulatory protein
MIQRARRFAPCADDPEGQALRALRLESEMPTYEYLCEKCGHEFEREQRITEEPVKTCPSCRARKVRRLISRTAFVLKGSGWYSDLYASPKPGKDSASEGGGEAKAEARPEGSGDGPSAPASESKSDAGAKKDGSGKKKGGKTKASRAA